MVRTFSRPGRVERNHETNQVSGPRPASGAGVPRPGNSALHLAVVNGHFELAAMLLEAGADPNAAGVGYTPLHILTMVRKPGGGDNDPAPRGSGTMTSLELVKRFAKHGANLNARMTRRANIGLTGLNTLGATPFLMAARSGDAELMRTLAALGADPLIPNADDATPLIVAAGLGTRSPGEDAGTESEVLEAVQVALELATTSMPSTTTARRRCTALPTRTFLLSYNCSQTKAQKSKSGTRRTSTDGRPSRSRRAPLR